VIVPSTQTTPETYLGTDRGEGWLHGPFPGLHDYGPPVNGELALNEFAYSGRWEVAGQGARAVAGAEIAVDFQAKDVYLVLGSPGGRPLGVRVLLDGRPISQAQAGADVHAAQLGVRRQRLYSLVSLARDERHLLSLRFTPGVSGYAFTFG
jgi:hypothetical protein